jgi:hypothetical protein
MEQLLLAAWAHNLNKKIKDRPLTGWEKDRLRAEKQTLKEKKA